MAIDTVEKRRCAGWNMPTPDGDISVLDRRQIAGNYRGLPIGVSLSGSITPVGGLTRLLTLYRSLSGGLTPSGDLTRLLTLYRAFGGTLNPTGNLSTILTYILTLGGELNFEGSIAGRNAAWLLLDDNLTWMGEWSATQTYDMDDVVLHKAGNEWHVFVSKAGHNTGNVPTSSAPWWRRFYQEQWL